MVVLAWLNNSPNTWQTFVANQTAEIQELTAISEWRHVKGKENPADLVSRGLSPCKLVDNELWFKGPSWLHSNVADISPNALNAALRQNYWIISPRSIIISNTTRGYEIAGNFRSHYTSTYLFRRQFPQVSVANEWKSSKKQIRVE
jgi:hypothetical protein